MTNGETGAFKKGLGVQKINPGKRSQGKKETSLCSQGEDRLSDMQVSEIMYSNKQQVRCYVLYASTNRESQGEAGEM